MSREVIALLLVFLGGGLGSVLRYGVNQFSSSLFGIQFPWGTLFVNVTGCLMMGVLAAWFMHRDDIAVLWSFLGTGVLGGFTTFSAFSLDALMLWQRDNSVTAALYIFGSVVAACAAVAIGFRCGRFLF